jgi:hypothetical protein
MNRTTAEASKIDGRKVEITALVFAFVFTTLPFFVSHFVPATDLPQHLAQIKMYTEVISHHQPTQYAVHIFGANLLVYWLLLGNWMIFPPILAGKITILMIALFWLIAILALARVSKRSFVVALFCVPFIFNSSLYWGFINFLIGFPLFVLWYIYILNDVIQPPGIKKAVLTILLSLFLFFAHALWLLVALIVLGVTDIVEKIKIKNIFWQLISLTPVVIIAVVWYQKLAAFRSGLGFDTAPHWFVSPLERLNPEWIVNSVFGGLRGSIEWIIFIGIIIWIVLALYANRGELWKSINKKQFAAGLVFLTIVFFAPNKYMNTISFAARWFPVAMIFIVMSIPPPKFLSQFLFIYVFFFLFTFSLITTLIWHKFEANELSGLSGALQKIPENQSVLGLDLVKESNCIKGRPFLQTFAYAQVLHGGTLNFSFAEHYSGIVDLKSVQIHSSWTHGLEWSAERVKFEDFDHFDYVLVNSQVNFYPVFNSIIPVLEPITTNGRWRLYKCKANNELKGPVFGALRDDMK